MAVLSEDELAEFRSDMARNSATQSWSKAQFKAAIQAVEDFMQQSSTKTGLLSAIEAAAPGAFTNQQKQDLFVMWSKTYARRQG